MRQFPRTARDRRAETGAVSVEFALLVPLLLMLVVGTVHFGTVLVARHRVTDAANFATRAAAVSGVVAPGPIQAQVLARLGAGANSCATLTVTPTLVADPNGFNVLNVDVTCDLAPTPGAPLLGAVGPESFTVTAAMPF